MLFSLTCEHKTLLNPWFELYTRSDDYCKIVSIRKFDPLVKSGKLKLLIHWFYGTDNSHLYFKEKHKVDIAFVYDIEYSRNQVTWFLNHYSSLNADVSQPNACALIVQMKNDAIEQFSQPLEEKNNDDVLQTNDSPLIVQVNNDIILSPTPQIQSFYQPLEKKNSWGTLLKKPSFNIESNNFTFLEISLRSLVKKNITVDNLDQNKESSEKKKEAISVGKDVIQVQEKSKRKRKRR